MMTVNIKLDTIEKVKEFSKRILEFKEDCDIASNNYVIDAKSIMGIFSLDLSKTLKLTVHGDITDMTPIKDFIV